jgi:hypothetical protein
MIFFDTIPADSLNIYFILLFSFSKCPLLLIKVDFDWNFALNKYSLCTMAATKFWPSLSSQTINRIKTFKTRIKHGRH